MQETTTTGETLILGYLYFLRKGYLELNPELLLKSKNASIGEVHVWRDKKQHRKTANGWVDVVKQRIKQPRGKETKGYFISSYDRRLYNHYKAFFKDKDVKTSFKNYKEYLRKKGNATTKDKYLSPLEAFCLYHYSTFRGYGEVNNAIKSHTQNHTTRQFQLLLTGILRKLPKYTDIAYRGTSLNIHTVESLTYKMKNEIKYTANKFLSSSPDINNANRYLQNIKNQKEGYIPVLFIIASKKGRDISNYRIHPDKTEVLFEPFAQFKIVDIKQKEGYSEIRLREV